MKTKGVIFDLDGVIVTTDEYHYQAWKYLADEEGIYFDRDINEHLRGVSRMDSLEILLSRAKRAYSAEEKEALADRKNSKYRELLTQLTPDHIFPGVLDMIDDLKGRGIKVAIGSASRNTPTILANIGLETTFDAVADGNSTRRSKPDPEVFLLAAQRLELAPEHCVVVEDAKAGVEAALAGGMRVLAVGFASSDPRATRRAGKLTDVTVDELLSIE